MTIRLTVPRVDGTSSSMQGDLASGVGRVLETLGQGVGVEVLVGESLQISGTDVALTPGAGAVYSDPTARTLSQLIHHRTQLVEAALQVSPPEPVVHALRLLLGELATGAGGDQDTSRPAEEVLADLVASTDDRPLLITLHPEDAGRFFPDPLVWDLELRSALFDRFSVAVPPAFNLDPAASRGVVTLRIRGLEYPPLQLPADVEAARQRVWQHCADVAAHNLSALVTPRAVEAALLLTHDVLPRAEELANRRWSPASLISIVRCGLVELASGPADLPALIERAALLLPPDTAGMDPAGAQLAREFPGLTAAAPGWMTRITEHGSGRQV